MPPSLLGVEACQGLADLAPDALLVVDDLGAVVLVNARAAQLLGSAPDDVVGTALTRWLPDGPVDDRLVGLPTSAPVPVTGRRADGVELLVEVAVRPLAEGSPHRCVVLRDLSAYAAVVRAKERLREELIASVSHELRTPLTSIMGYTEILVDLGEPVVSAEAQRILTIVRRNAERQLGVVEDLLTLSVLGGEGVAVAPVPTDLGPVLQAVLVDVGSFAAEAGVALVSAGLESLRVLGDPARLHEVVDSLVRQAVKLSARGEQVEVRLVAEPAHALLEVRDQSALDAHGGTGLAGLGGPVLRGIVEAHAGALGVDHVPGAGTTVQVRLPLARA